jgi:hypothetical protein
MKRLRTGSLAGHLVTRHPALRLSAVLLCGVALALLTAVAAEPTLTFIDLQPKANQPLSEDMHGGQGNNLENVPRGEQKMADSRFKIGEKMIHLRGEHVPDAPVKVEGIAVNATFDQLHILHSTGYGEGQEQQTDGSEIGAYVVHYADKTSERIPIVYGQDLRDWWDWPNREDQSVKRAKVAWIGTNAAQEGSDRHIRLFAVVWTNPHPEKQVTTIDVESKETMSDPFVLALTLEKKG